jgi:hypothetical protein
MITVRTIQYRCRKTDGTGTAGPILTPLFQAWATPKGLHLASGTLNLCAHRDVVLPAEFARLQPWDAALSLDWRKTTPGYDPRLYFIALTNRQPAWLFRWSDDEHIQNFVGDTPGCPARRRCEVIAEVNLSALLRLDTGAEVTFHFV